MKLLRLRGRKNCDRLQRTGTLWKGKNFFVRFAYGHLRHPAANPSRKALYVGLVTSTKLSKSAVERNRMRRRCREAIRVFAKGLQECPTAQLLILPRSSSLKAPFSDLQHDVRTFFSQLTHGA